MVLEHCHRSYFWPSVYVFFISFLLKAVILYICWGCDSMLRRQFPSPGFFVSHCIALPYLSSSFMMMSTLLWTILYVFRSFYIALRNITRLSALLLFYYYLQLSIFVSMSSWFVEKNIELLKWFLAPSFWCMPLWFMWEEKRRKLYDNWKLAYHDHRMFWVYKSFFWS